MTTHSFLRICVFVCTMALFATWISPVAAQRASARAPRGFTWGELAVLPDYCRDTQGVLYGAHGSHDDSPRAAEWVAKMGEDFWHMHHYCYALRDMRQATEAGASPSRKTYLYLRAVGDLMYVVNNCQPSMPLFPEVYLKLGEVYLLQGNVVDAKVAFERARLIRPDYWPAYTRWIDVLVPLKLHKEAKALAEEGLRHAPDAEPLRQAFIRLGGNPAAVKPAATAAAAAPPNAGASGASAADTGNRREAGAGATPR